MNLAQRSQSRMASTDNEKPSRVSALQNPELGRHVTVLRNTQYVAQCGVIHDRLLRTANRATIRLYVLDVIGG